jgi:hypothetical protein
MTSVYHRIGTVDIQTVRLAQDSEYDRIIKPGKQPPAKAEYFGQRVKLFSKGTRLKTFYKHGTKCSACGLEAQFYAVERPSHESGDFPYHLNLWGIDVNGTEVLFTHDHTLARSAGGADNIGNTTTMCSPCNFAKSLTEKRGK